VSSFSIINSVTLTALPAPGYVISSWSGGGCGGNGTTCSPSTSSAISVAFVLAGTPAAGTSAAGSGGSSSNGEGGSSGTAGGTSQPVVADNNEPPAPAIVPPVQEAIAVGVSGGGTVRGTVSGRRVAQIACGAGGATCYGKFKPGTVLTMAAIASKGFVFRGWSGSCSGAGLKCHLKLDSSKTVYARFLPAARQSFVSAEIDKAIFDVRWSQGVGIGMLLVRGRIDKAASLRIDLRGTGARSVLTRQFSVPAGPFTLPLPLASEARILPGGFVIGLSGRSGEVPVSPQVTTAILAAPRQGVVARAFASTSQNGSPSSLVPAGAHQLWAHFVFQAQPAPSVTLTVAWYSPSGRLVGIAKKSDRPAIISSVRSGRSIPAGMWRVELVADGVALERLDIHVRG
jgi:hypothetical protein